MASLLHCNVHESRYTESYPYIVSKAQLGPELEHNMHVLPSDAFGVKLSGQQHCRLIRSCICGSRTQPGWL